MKGNSGPRKFQLFKQFFTILQFKNFWRIPEFFTQLNSRSENFVIEFSRTIKNLNFRTMNLEACAYFKASFAKER